MDRVQECLDTEGLSLTTIENYGSILRYLEKWLAAEELTFDYLTPSQFRRFVKTRQWNNSSERGALCAVKRYARFSRGERHPILAMRIKVEESDPGRVLEPEQIVPLLRSIASQRGARAVRDMALVLLMLDTGLRASEVCRLTVNRVDLKRLKLSVLQKGGKVRWSMISPETSTFIQEWLEVRKKYAKCDALFVGLRGGKQHTRHGIKDIYRKLGQLSEIGLISPHDIRRTACCEAIRRGVPMDLIAKQMGWKSIRMVEHYGRQVTVEAYREYLPKYELHLKQKREPTDQSRLP